MHNRRRVCVVVTARPSYSRIKTAMQCIQSHPDLELQVVVTASALLDRYGRVANEIVRDGFAIDAEAYTVLEGESPISMAKTTGLGVTELASVFDNLGPDVVVTIADRFETIATAIAASYMNIPLVHVQGGEVTGSIDEKVRHAVTKLADLHLVANSTSASRLVKMGEHAETVKVTGCPSIDLISESSELLDSGFDPFEQFNGVGPRLDLRNGYLVVMQHPVTTEHNDARTDIEETLAAVANSRIPSFWFWPNIDAGSDGTSKGIRAFREANKDLPIHFFKSLPPTDFLRLLNNADCLIGNSSAGIRECAYLGVPVVNVGTRQSGRERAANVIDVGHNRAAILEAISFQIRRGRYPQSTIYGDGKAGSRIADEIARMRLSVEKRIAY